MKRGSSKVSERPVRKSALVSAAQSGVSVLQLRDVVISEDSAMGFYNLRLPSGSDGRFSDIFGIGLPTKPNTYETDGQLGCLWLGPDEWLLAAADDGRDAMPGKLDDLCETEFATWTDQSSALVAFRVSGNRAIDLLGRGVLVDLHPSKFGFGECRQTMLAQAGVTIVNRSADDQTQFLLLVRRSFADYLWLWLADKGGEAEFSNDRFG